jgi:hypothetical protein
MQKQSLIETLAFHRFEESEVSTEATQNEYEVEIYAILKNPDEVIQKASSHELQEQWGCFIPKTAANAGSMSIRVRMTQLADEEPGYVLCSKTDGGELGRKEVEHDSCRDQFDQFRMAADQGLKKIRYNVPHHLESIATDIVYQVDMFRNTKGELVPWAKIDAEVQPGTKIAPSDIPFEYTELIIVTPEAKKADAALREKIGRLYAKYFRTANEMIPQAETA